MVDVKGIAKYMMETGVKETSEGNCAFGLTSWTNGSERICATMQGSSRLWKMCSTKSTETSFCICAW